MRKTRRAAAMCMTMSLAVSTVLGNTAWGEVTVNTKKNHCTHVHTEECYEDADEDETATPSQSGKRKPTACTHVCTVESGCLADDEDTEEDDAWATATSSDADQEDADSEKDEDGGVSVGTPSNADDKGKDTSQIKILSWSWLDPERNLTDGRLELTGVTPEAQPSFEDITEYLPKTIIAETGEDEDWEAEYLDLAGWTCDEYTQDEEGLWPLNGTYEFAAELPEGYALADDVEALIVEVSVEGDQAVTLASQVWYLTIYKDGVQKDIKWDSDNFQPVSGDGWRVTKEGEDSFRLTLNNANLNEIYIQGGTWTIEPNGVNTLEKSSTNTGLYICRWANATIDGPGTLNTKGFNTGHGIQVEGTLTIKNGVINASASPFTGGVNNARVAGIMVTSTGNLNIVGGMITASGDHRYGFLVEGTFTMTGGNLNITANDYIVSEVNTSGSFELSGGTINIWSANNYKGLVVNSNNTSLNGGTLIVDILAFGNNKSMTIEPGGRLEITKGLDLSDGGKLINWGTLVMNGSLAGSGTVVNEGNGTISGTGTVPDGARQKPDDIGIKKNEVQEEYDGTKISVPESAEITAPSKAGELVYEVVEDESTGTGTINSETGVLTVEKVGIFKIKVYTKSTGIYQEGTPVFIELTVNPAKVPNTWSASITAVDTEYAGRPISAVAEVTTGNIPAGAVYQYQLEGETEWSDQQPQVENVVDSGKKVSVKISVENYEPMTVTSLNSVTISPASLKENITSSLKEELVYNGTVRIPSLHVTKEFGEGFSADLTEGTDYEISGYYTASEEPVSEPVDAGEYKALLTAKGKEEGTISGNYTGTVYVPFTIQKWRIVPNMVGRTFNKIYDGTRNVNNDQELRIYFWTSKEGWTLREIQASNVQWEYEGENVGKHYLRAYDIAISEEYQKNYELTRTEVKYVGNILKRDFASITVSADPLTYNGEEQQAQISACVDTGLANVPADAVYTYSLDGVDFQSEMPSFTEAGTYLVHVKAEMDNFNEATETVPVTVQKAEAPAVAEVEESYGYKETGENRLKLPEIPADCGTLGTMEAKIVSDEGQILTGDVTVSGSELVFQLKGSSRTQIGQTARILVMVETQNYQDIQIPVTITLKGESGNSGSGSRLPF